MDKKKNILIITLHADPMLPAGIGEYGGGHMYPYELLVGLAKEEFNVCVITRKSEKSLSNIDKINESATIYRLDYGDYPFYDKRDFYNLRDISFSLTCDLLEKYHICPDIIHSLYWNSGYLAMQLSHKLHIPYVHSPISIGAIIQKENAKEIEPHRIAIEKIVFENASQILSITESEKLNIIKYYNIDKRKISVIGRPIAQEYLYPVHDEWGNTRGKNMEYHPSLPSFKSYEMPEKDNWWEKKAFIYVGRIHPNKGIHHIINAWVMLRKQYKDLCPPLWLVGGIPAEINLFHIEQNLHLDVYERNGEIVWWGRLNAEGISTLYTRSLALIMHSKYEPGGRVSMEAMSASLPVIATPCGFAADTVTDWYTGFLVNYGDEKQLKQRMSMFILQPYLANSMGFNAKQTALRISQKWSFMKHHISIYNQILSSHYNHNEKNDFSIREQWIWGFISAYPAKLPEVPDSFIQKKFEDMGIMNIHISNKACLEDLGYFTWNVRRKNEQILILQPYTKLNILRLMDIKRYSKISFADTVYSMFERWMPHFPSPLLFCDKEKNLIFTKKYNILDFNLENFTSVIEFITKHKNFISSQTSEEIGRLLSNKYGLYETISRYQEYTAAHSMFTQGDFSIELEAEWILNKIKESGFLQNLFSPNLISYLLKITVGIETNNVVLGGFVHCECICYNNNQLYLLIPSMLHPVEDGYDEGKLLVLTAWHNTDIEFWSSLIQKIPNSIRQYAIKWAVIFLIKGLYLKQIMYPGSQEINDLLCELEILIEIENQPKIIK